jgi:hypothetical protein
MGGTTAHHVDQFKKIMPMHLIVAGTDAHHVNLVNFHKITC